MPLLDQRFQKQMPAPRTSASSVYITGLHTAATRWYHTPVCLHREALRSTTCSTRVSDAAVACLGMLYLRQTHTHSLLHNNNNNNNNQWESNKAQMHASGAAFKWIQTTNDVNGHVDFGDARVRQQVHCSPNNIRLDVAQVLYWSPQRQRMRMREQQRRVLLQLRTDPLQRHESTSVARMIALVSNVSILGRLLLRRGIDGIAIRMELEVAAVEVCIHGRAKCLILNGFRDAQQTHYGCGLRAGDQIRLSIVLVAIGNHIFVENGRP
jgi:hypothetical protein